MIYKAQLYCLCFLAVLYIICMLREREKTRVNKYFQAILISSFANIITDIWTVYTINHEDIMYTKVNRISHQFFFITFILMFLFVYEFLGALIEQDLGKKIASKKIDYLPACITFVGSMFLPVYYMKNKLSNYCYGPAVYLIYACVCIYAIMIVYLVSKYWKIISQKNKQAMIIAFTGETMTILYTFFRREALCSSLGVVLVCLCLFVTVANPDVRLVNLLKKETERADKANEAKTHFLANMSHEIRTPINAVLGMDEIILRESTEDNIKEYAIEIKNAAKNLLGIINDILDINKIEAGKLEIIPVEYNTASFINDIYSMIYFKTQEKGLEFNVITHEGIPSDVIGDDIRIRQILVNLLNNAVKYTREGSVTLEVEMIDNNKIKYTVRDTGIGIKEEDIAKLYIPFKRIEEKRNRNIEGTGLGINITMQLLELMNSELEVSSVYGEGTEFSFIIEQEIVDSTPIENFTDKIQVSIEEDYKTAYIAPEAKILIVDDNESNLKVFSNLLKETQVQITEALSGFECLDLVKETHYDIIFMDHMMPKMDGVQTLEELRKMDDNLSKDTPVIILTANAIVGAKEYYLSMGFDAFLSKPIEPNKLEDLLFNTLDSNLLQPYEKKKIKKNNSNIELPIVEGIDWSYARLHFNKEELILDTVKMFYATIQSDVVELQGYYDNIDDMDMLKQYQIKVHSMKNSAAMIGIVQLTGIAMELEQAARDGQITTIQSLHDIFTSRYLSYSEKLKAVLPQQSNKKDATQCQEEINEIFDKIRTAASDMDVDTLDEMSAKLDEYDFDENKNSEVEKIKLAILNLDVDYLINM